MGYVETDKVLHEEEIDQLTTVRVEAVKAFDLDGNYIENDVIFNIKYDHPDELIEMNLTLKQFRAIHTILKKNKAISVLFDSNKENDA